MSNRALVIALQNDLNEVRIDLMNTQNERNDLRRQLKTAEDNIRYWRDQVYTSSTAWSKKYSELLDSHEKQMEALALHSVNIIKDLAAKQALKIEQTRTDTLGDCFAHVTGLLAERNK